MKKINIDETTPIYLLAVMILSYPIFGLIITGLSNVLIVQWDLSYKAFWFLDVTVVLGDLTAAVLISKMYFKNIFVRVVVFIIASAIFLFVQNWCFLSGYFLAATCFVLAMWFCYVKYYSPKRVW